MTYVYAGSIRVASLTTQATTTGTESNTFYYHGDHLGSSSIITDGSGTVVRNISYQPWGNVHTNTEESGANTPDPNHKFTGQILDDSTDLYYYGARYYDPVLRRFITPDTIIQSPYDPQSLNRYAYCRNNPLIYTDPTGHWSLGNFVQSVFQALPYALTFTNPYAAVAMGTMYSMQSTAANGGSDSDVLRSGGIGLASSAIGQGVAQGIAPAGIGEGFGRTVAAGAAAGFASGGAGAIMSGQSGANAWKAAYQGAALGAGTAGVMWGITQGNSEIALYREAVSSYRQAVRSLDINQGTMYADASLSATDSGWSPTLPRVSRWTGRILAQSGYKISGRTLSIVGAAIEPGGMGKMTGIIAGGATGAKIGTIWGTIIAPGPGTFIGGVSGGIIGGMIGGEFGSWFDYPGAGQLNYNE